MKKSLVIISFAFIFLLSVSVVSASWFGDFWGKVSGKGTTVIIEGGCDKVGGPGCPKKTIAGATECVPPVECRTPEGGCVVCIGGAAPGSVIGVKRTQAGVSPTLTRRPIPGMNRRPVARTTSN